MMFERSAPEQHDTLEEVLEPRENPQLCGHTEAASRLTAWHRSGRLPHALVFAGPKGIGKATLAFHFAHHLLKHPDPQQAPELIDKPDPSSALFRQLACGAHPSVLHLSRPRNDKGTGFKTVLTVDEIRKVGRFLSHTSHDGGYRVVIVDPADDLNNSAANALLKSLEEPPARALFILVAHVPGRLLPTIRSRCQIIKLAPLAPQELVAAMGDAATAIDSDDRRTALAERSGGSVRAAIQLLRYGGLDIADFMDEIAVADTYSPFEAHQMADAVAPRDQAVAFDIFNDHALSRLAEEGARAAVAGDLVRANRISLAWQEAQAAVTDTESYNLDRKQHALEMLARLNRALRA